MTFLSKFLSLQILIIPFRIFFSSGIAGILISVETSHVLRIPFESLCPIEEIKTGKYDSYVTRCSRPIRSLPLIKNKINNIFKIYIEESKNT